MTESLGPHSIEPLGVELPEGKEDSFGRSVPGIEHRIVDPETGDDLPAGETGEIWIRGYSLMLGLLGRDRAEVFEPGRLVPHRRQLAASTQTGTSTSRAGWGHGHQGGRHQRGPPGRWSWPSSSIPA